MGTQFPDSDELFIEHTLLVNSADVIAHLMLGLNAEELAPATLLSGAQFTLAGLHGVVDHDFFDWVLEVKGGDQYMAASPAASPASTGLRSTMTSSRSSTNPSSPRRHEKPSASTTLPTGWPTGSCPKPSPTRSTSACWTRHLCEIFASHETVLNSPRRRRRRCDVVITFGDISG